MNEQQAQNAMFGAFLTAWMDNSGNIVGYQPFVEWPFTVVKTPPAPDRYYARVWKANDNSQQVTLGRPRRWRTTGLLYIQIFAPTSDKQAPQRLTALAEAARSVYAVPSAFNGLSFTNVLNREMPAEATWFCRRVSAHYSFDELR